MNNFFKQFGGKVTQKHIKEYEQSEQWRDGSFKNLEHTTLGGNILDLPRIIYKQLSNKKGRIPENPLPVKKFEIEEFLTPSDKAKFIWYGHSALLIRIQEMNILIDPMLGDNTTPMAPIATKRFSENTLSIIDDFPEIDLVLLTHDHYDHLDFDSIQKLKNKTKQFFVALGVKRHLVAWGIDEKLITEFDWWMTEKLDQINITFTPTRHFSGRGLRDGSKTLWGGWVIKSRNENIWFSGDGGYGNHFKEIGEILGPFDIGFMECGQYNDDWKLIHLFPEEAIKAAKEAKVKKAIPVHWGGFPLSYQHTWKEPAEDFVTEAINSNQDYMLPSLGELCSTSDQLKNKWWFNFK
ncbi:MBL fold metallo-hydrolase [Tenacibaculum sp. 190524A05c]|uniref:MBL fold metallo-hydrolase n=1 Tax=Tenacibaculum platacis TaxID=3137852 RepID=UPI0031FB30A2